MSSELTTLLLRWFKVHQRRLPWREEKDPYKIWLSEVMLQQTQVDTVIPYYKRWLRRFPTLTAVAKASQDQVLKQWEGLGYYSRARNFHSACQEVFERFGGRVPNQPEVFAKLKGVGPYTNAAVQSIAFHQPLPAVDGNVKRVVSRLLRLSQPPSRLLGEIEAFLRVHLSHQNPGDFNQAMMELGATVCRARLPNCARCPISMHCQAYQRNQVLDYPKPEPKRHRPLIYVAAGVIWKQDKILIAKRKEKGMLGGLWEFPGGKLELGESLERCVVREVKEELGISVIVGELICTISHAYTHFSVEVSCFSCLHQRGTPKPLASECVKWVRVEDLKRFPFPKSNHKIFPFLPQTNPF